jgi:hypothetical protein
MSEAKRAFFISYKIASYDKKLSMEIALLDIKNIPGLDCKQNGIY